MASYLQVSSDIAGRVASGELAAGQELPGAREAARQHGTTSATVAHAYRHLASAGVLAAAEPLIAALRDPAMQSAVNSLGGYDLSKTGTVQMLD